MSRIILFISSIIIILLINVNCSSTQNKVESEPNSLDSLILKYPDSIPLLVKRGRLYFEEYQMEKALNDAAKAFRLDSNSIDTRLLYADVINNLPGRSVNDIVSAQKHFEWIITKDKKNTHAFVSLASTYAQQMDFDNSFTYINKALKIDQKYRDAYILKGSNYLKLGNMKLAKSSYETAIQQDVEFYEAYLMLGALYQSENNPVCVEYYTTAAKLRPNNLDVLYAYAYALQNYNQVNQAKEIYRKMIKLDSNYVESNFQLGYIKQWLENDLDSAMYFYGNAIQIKPDYVEAWHNMGICYLDKGDKPKALQSFRKALEFDPEFELSKDMALKAQ